MKTCLLLVSCVIVFAFAPAKGLPAKTYFYYCVSKPVDNNTKEKQTILYCGIRQIETEDLTFTKAKAKKWGDLVSTQCTSRAGCTSDFNYYPTREQAKTGYAQTLQDYSDTSKYILKKVKFQ